MSNDDIVKIPDCKCIHTSTRAILVVIKVPNGSRKHWIPMSLLSPTSKVMTVGEAGELHIPAWFADKEGIDHD